MYQANHAARQADVLLALGMRFDDRTSSSWIPGYSFSIPPTKLIHVDIDPDEIARNYPVHLGLMADIRTFIRQILNLLESKKDSSLIPKNRINWLNEINSYKKEWNKFVAPGFKSNSSPIHPQRAVREIEKAIPKETILVSDVGVHHNWLLQFFNPKTPLSLIGSMGFGSMGFGVAGALGAKLGAPDQPVISVCGDGGFLMHANVLATAIEYKIPIIWIIWNNFAYASIQGLQKGFLYGRELATQFRDPDSGKLYNPDFAKIALAAGISGVTVDRAGDLGDAVKHAISANTPYLIDANIAADLNPSGAGVWELPGLGTSTLGFGQVYSP